MLTLVREIEMWQILLVAHPISTLMLFLLLQISEIFRRWQLAQQKKRKKKKKSRSGLDFCELLNVSLIENSFLCLVISPFILYGLNTQLLELLQSSCEPRELAYANHRIKMTEKKTKEPKSMRSLQNDIVMLGYNFVIKERQEILVFEAIVILCLCC